MLRRDLTDMQRERIKDPVPGKATDCGVTAGDNRLFVDAVLWIAGTGSPWRDPSVGVRAVEQRVRALCRLGEDGHLGESFQRVSRQSRFRIPDHRFNHRAGASTRARRYEKTSTASMAMLFLTGAMIWLR